MNHQRINCGSSRGFCLWMTAVVFLLGHSMATGGDPGCPREQLLSGEEVTAIRTSRGNAILRARLVLADKHENPDLREEAAILLGSLQGTECISVLLDNIAMPSRRAIRAKSTLTGYPCAEALANMGDANIPAVVAFIASCEAPDSQIPLATDVLLAGDDIRNARTFVRGMLAESSGDAKARLGVLLKTLDRWLDNSSKAQLRVQEPLMPTKKP